MSVVAANDSGLVEVRLVQLPVELQAAAEEHNEELLREFSHIVNSDAETAERIPGRLLSLIARLRAQYAAFTGPPRDRLEQARAAGDPTVDLVYRVPPSARTVVGEFNAQLEEADAFCRSGHLLTLATPAELVTFRRWFLSEFERQIAGHPPTPWPAFVPSGDDHQHPEGPKLGRSQER